MGVVSKWFPVRDRSGKIVMSSYGSLGKKGKEILKEMLRNGGVWPEGYKQVEKNYKNGRNDEKVDSKRVFHKY